MSYQFSPSASAPAANSEASTPVPALLVLLAAPRGFCAGVVRAIDAVLNALDRYGPPVYVRHAIVHNQAVVRWLETKGAVFVQELDGVPEGAVVILSAHGVPRSVSDEARRRTLQVLDAVCPLVAKVHREVVRHHANGRHIVLIGHRGHPEIIGTLGQLPPGSASVAGSAKDVESLQFDDDVPVAYAVQTTFSVDEAESAIKSLTARFSDVQGPRDSDICFATANRQAAIRAIAGRVDAVVVAGEHFSSNACRLAEVAEAAGCRSVQLVSDVSQLDWSRIAGARALGLTAAASTPETTVSDIVNALRTRFDLQVEEVGNIIETTVFKPLKIA